MVTRQAPSAWRAISPVSIVIVCSPKGNDFLMDFTGFSCGREARSRPVRRRRRNALEESGTTNPAGACRASRGSVGGEWSLLAQAEALDQRAIGLDPGALQVIEQAAPLAHELEQPPARVEIL